MTTEPPPSPTRHIRFRPGADRNTSTIRLRRIRSKKSDLRPRQPQVEEEGATQANVGWPRSAPQRPTLGAGAGATTGVAPELPVDGQPAPPGGAVAPQSNGTEGLSQPPGVSTTGPPRAGGRRNTMRGRRPSLFGRLSYDRYAPGSQAQASIEELYDPRIVDMLDAIDPEVSTLSSITNVQNSLFIPSLGRYVNRQPLYTLGPLTPPAEEDDSKRKLRWKREASQRKQDTQGQTRPSMSDRPGSLRYDVGERYAVLPDGVSLDGWSEADVAELNDYVRHMLHSKRSGFRRSLKAFGKYVSQPLGFFVTLYGTLITLFGLAWVLFLIGWIYVGDKQLYVINVIDYVLVALFAVVGDGLIPFRAIDTYHMIFIARYHRLTWKLRNKMALPKLENRNDLPTELAFTECDTNEFPDLEAGGEDRRQASNGVDEGEHQPGYELSVLTPKQQARLVHHQTKFAKSHTFYKPHETETHRAFPLNLLVAIVVLLDVHSCLQVSLGACTWGIDYHGRPAALTATILSCSIAVNITAGILISVGDRRTRKKDVIERMFKQQLTEDAIKKMREKREKEAEKSDGTKEKGSGLGILPGRENTSEDSEGRK